MNIPPIYLFCRWSKIASHLPGRTDNEIKNQWNTHVKKKLRKMGLDPLTHNPLPPPSTTEVQPAAAETASLQHEINKDLLLVNNADFCVDEIPVIEPLEILVPSNEDSSTPSTSSSSYNSCSVGGASLSSNGLEDLKVLPDFEDCYSEILNSNIWDDDGFLV